MPIYSISAPDGNTYQIQGPANATQEQVQSEVLKQHPTAAILQKLPQSSVTVQGAPDNLTMGNIASGVKGILPSLALGAAKPLVGLNQAAWQLAGKVAPSVANMGDYPVQKINEYQQQLNQAAGPIASKFTTEPAALVGENILPMAGMNKVSTAIGQAPNLMKMIGSNALTGAALGYATPEKTGLTPEQFANEKAKTVGTSAALNVAPSAVGAGSQLLGSLLRKGTGISTGAGNEAITQAYQAGKTSNPDFIANMRGEAPMEDVLNQAKSNLADMRQERNSVYRSGMTDISKDNSILSFDKIDDEIKKAKDIGSFKGETTNPNAIKALQEIKQSVNKWKSLDPAEYHTPEGVDALKQRVGAILEDIPYHTKARNVADSIYSSIKSTINEQAPVYKDVMKDYSERSDLIKEIEKSLSLGNKASVSTGLTKLQSLMRNNVNANYGYRQELANKLMDAGGRNLMPALAGQALSSWTPRGIVGQGLDVGAGLGAVLSGGAHLPGLMATTSATSPRLVGETAYKAGQIASKIPNLTDEQSQLSKLLMIRAAQGEK